MLYNLEGPLVGNWWKLKCEVHVNVQDLEYADDMALVSDCMNTLEEVIQAFSGLWVGMRLTH